jgi:hypothetical protein
MSQVPKMPYTCAGCRWWVPGKKLLSGQALPGQCRRNPPTYSVNGSRWPATDGHEWCGEHHRLWEETRVSGEPVKPNDALGRLVQTLDTETEGTPAAVPTGQAAALSTGGADPDSRKLADAGSPSRVQPAAFERRPRRR